MQMFEERLKFKTGMNNTPVSYILVVNNTKASSNLDHPTGGVFHPCFPVSSVV